MKKIDSFSAGTHKTADKGKGGSSGGSVNSFSAGKAKSHRKVNSFTAGNGNGNSNKGGY